MSKSIYILVATNANNKIIDVEKRADKECGEENVWIYESIDIIFI